MNLKSVISTAVAASLSAAPALAAPASTAGAKANPASSLSLSPSVRAGKAVTKASRQDGGTSFGIILAGIIVVGIAAILIVDATKNDNAASR